MAKVQSSFSPTKQGFRFINYFELKLPVKFQLPLVGTLDLNDVVYGLCGGMCFTALDYYYLQQSLPKYTSPKEIDTKLLVYLGERQLDSLPIQNLLKVIDWMVSGNDELANRTIKNEIPRLCRLLTQGDPAVLCLIRTQGFENPTHNHQVLATGFDLDEKSETIKITLYDPNHPGESPTITASMNRKQFSIQQSTGEALRGFFLIPYKAKKAVPLPARPHAVSFGFDSAPEPAFQLKWPVDSRRINQRFGENPETYRPFKLAGHEGLDFFAPTGAKIYAMHDGTVYEAKFRGAYGNQVRIRHEHNGVNFQTVYAHMEKILATVNQVVKAGDLIGIADNTGNSHGSHLHMTLMVDGAKTPGYYDGIVDPWPYLEGNEPVPLPLPSGITVCTTASTRLRSLPSLEQSEVLTTIPGGERLPVFGEVDSVREKIGKQDQWLQVQTFNGQAGYIAAWLATDLAQLVLPPSDLIVYPFDELALRPGPGLGLAPVGKLTSSTPLVVLGSSESAKEKIGKQAEWLMVQPQEGPSGFVPAWLVHVTGQIAPATGMTVFSTRTINLRAQSNTEPTTDVLAVATPSDALAVLGDKDQARANIGVQGKWLNVRAPNGVVGWCAAWLVALQGIAPPVSGQKPAVVVIVFPTPNVGINLRATRDVSAMRISGANFGQPLTVLEDDLDAARKKIGVEDQWVYVQKASGERGWAAAWLVSLSA